MNEAQRSITTTYSREQILQMSATDIATLMAKAGPNAVFRGKAVVRKANGEIRYDKDAVPGEFGETPDEMAAIDQAENA